VPPWILNGGTSLQSIFELWIRAWVADRRSNGSLWDRDHFVQGPPKLSESPKLISPSPRYAIY